MGEYILEKGTRLETPTGLFILKANLVLEHTQNGSDRPDHTLKLTKIVDGEIPLPHPEKGLPNNYTSHPHYSLEGARNELLEIFRRDCALISYIQSFSPRYGESIENLAALLEKVDEGSDISR